MTGPSVTPPVWLLMICAVGLVLGLAVYGYGSIATRYGSWLLAAA